MIRFPSRATKSATVDSVPEERDGLVSALRQAYASTNIPEGLVPGIVRALGEARTQPASPTSFGRRGLLQAGAVLVPAGTIAAIAVLVVGVNRGSGPPAATISGRSVVWTNQTGLGLQVDAAQVSPGVVRIAYHIPIRGDSGFQPLVRSDGVQHTPPRRGLLRSAPRLPLLTAYANGSRLRKISCAGHGPRARDTVTVCYATRDARRPQAVKDLLLVVPGGARTTAGAAPRVVGASPPSPRELAGRRGIPGKVATRICLPRGDACWLVTLNRHYVKRPPEILGKPGVTPRGAPSP